MEEKQDIITYETNQSTKIHKDQHRFFKFKLQKMQLECACDYQNIAANILANQTLSFKRKITLFSYFNAASMCYVTL